MARMNKSKKLTLIYHMFLAVNFLPPQKSMILHNPLIQRLFVQNISRAHLSDENNTSEWSTIMSSYDVSSMTSTATVVIINYLL